MVTRSEDLDSRLARYLDREEEDPVRRILHKQADWQFQHEKDDATRHGEVMRSLEGHAHRLGSLEFKAGELAKGVEDTGRHYVSELRGKVKRWDDLVWRIVTALVLVVGGAGVGALVYHLAQH